MKKILKKIFYSLPSSYVIMFHHIDNGGIVQKSGCKLDYFDFIKIIESNLNFVNVPNFFKFKKDQVLITFDDGLSDVYDVAYPELKKRNIPFVLFVIYDFLNTEGYITTNQLIEMSNDPLVTIGSHGLSHVVLKGESYNKQFDEIIKSKFKLESLLHKKINLFAYSHGQYDENTIRILKENKCYNYVFGVDGYPINFITKKWKYYLPRLNFENGINKYFIIKNKIKINVK